MQNVGTKLGKYTLELVSLLIALYADALTDGEHEIVCGTGNSVSEMLWLPDVLHGHSIYVHYIATNLHKYFVEFFAAAYAQVVYCSFKHLILFDWN